MDNNGHFSHSLTVIVIILVIAAIAITFPNVVNILGSIMVGIAMAVYIAMATSFKIFFEEYL
ncbi:hypothetical protein [Parashewanella tropica]|uniref:hypothetical protein n=1 Tax=Parashewanella tropica TaxID=2547970 RepID=UPI00105A55DE|nr:hypothetical protein [Parashewanella tropica]